MKYLLLTISLFFIHAASAQSVKLIWEANPETDIAGYRLHVGDESRVYITTIDVGTVLEYSMAIPSGIVQFFSVTAYNTAGFESAYSNEVSASIPSRVQNLKASPGTRLQIELIE